MSADHKVSCYFNGIFPSKSMFVAIMSYVQNALSYMLANYYISLIDFESKVILRTGAKEREKVSFPPPSP